ncbi:MAG TPA: hypothetical protein VF581_05545 [Flavobacterium sp.]|jgi:hypothetical protein
MYKLFLYFILIIFFSACHTAKIKSQKYLVSPAPTELGTIGRATVGLDRSNGFEVRAVPKLSNNIRVSIEIVPYTNKLTKHFAKKAKFNQGQELVTIIDSLPHKPEVVTIRMLDIMGLVEELNGGYNRDILQLVNNINEAQIITGVAVNLSVGALEKIKMADAYYLKNDRPQQYSVALFKDGKFTETLAFRPEDIVAYQGSSFCWAIDEKGKAYLADLVQSNTDCKGKTKSYIKEKEKTENLFKM